MLEFYFGAMGAREYLKDYQNIDEIIHVGKARRKSETKITRSGDYQVDQVIALETVVFRGKLYRTGENLMIPWTRLI